MFFGNLFVYYQFQGKDHIDESTRQMVFTVLIAVAILGVIFLATLRRVNHPFLDSGATDRELDYATENTSIIGAFKSAINLFLTRDMLLLNVTFLYTGKCLKKQVEKLSSAFQTYAKRSNYLIYFQGLNCHSSVVYIVPALDLHYRLENLPNVWLVYPEFVLESAKYSVAFYSVYWVRKL